MFSTDLSGGDGGGAKMSVTGIDADGDGTIDFLSITVGDTVLIWRVVR
jgi:hypothetical protein